MSEAEEQHERPHFLVAKPAGQIPSKSSSVHLHYEDKEFRCNDCGKTEVWTAQEQQRCFEVEKRSYYTTATRCADCRRKRRQRESPPRGFDERLSREDASAIKKVVRSLPGIDPRIFSANLTDDGTVEVLCGGASIGDFLILKFDDPDWVLQSREPRLFS
ncbi:MAG: hypothetical protein HOL01_07050 [Planctomycetaceae bacterium]|jgi:hypothetical protein|nr:hypothetical protein [Planctomycetaceae bacterium]MBT6486634.1 hypothetical protein [Planctomycetaceae bacterium]MBT6494297.1 hypothetical protein [Planctomycetaceae bacterium]